MCVELQICAVEEEGLCFTFYVCVFSRSLFVNFSLRLFLPLLCIYLCVSVKRLVVFSAY